MLGIVGIFHQILPNLKLFENESFVFKRESKAANSIYKVRVKYISFSQVRSVYLKKYIAPQALCLLPFKK